MSVKEYNRVMTQCNMLVARKGDFFVIRNLFKVVLNLAVNSVVVALNKNLTTIQPCKDCTGFFVVTPTNITQDVNQIILFNLAVPITN